MTNTETEEIEQTFTFKYDEKDILMYLTREKAKTQSTPSSITEQRVFPMRTESTAMFKKAIRILICIPEMLLTPRLTRV